VENKRRSYTRFVTSRNPTQGIGIGSDSREARLLACTYKIREDIQ
jgi:hypothetical protein